MNRLILSAIGNITDINAQSGTPYFIWRGLRDAGIELDALDLPTQHSFVVRRHAWLLKQLALGRHPRGYSRSIEYLEATWCPHLPFLDGVHLINHFQLFPPSVIERAEQGRLAISFYIDMTHKEMFENYAGHYRGFHKSLIRSTLELEKRGYDAARKIVTFSQSTARVLRADYGIGDDKIHVVMPGANIDEGDLAETGTEKEAGRDPSFVIGYTGMDYVRKGLPALAEATLLLRGKGLPVKLLVIGPEPASLCDVEGIELVGRIDKQTDMKRFIAVLRRCHIGVLPSQAEGLPISLLEFLRLGIPVIGTAINGIPDIVKDGVGRLIAKGAGPRELADAIEPFVTFGADYERMRRAAWELRRFASWKRAIPELLTALDPVVPALAAGAARSAQFSS